jgi:hypothetical protein
MIATRVTRREPLPLPLNVLPPLPSQLIKDMFETDTSLHPDVPAAIQRLETEISEDDSTCGRDGFNVHYDYLL